MDHYYSEVLAARQVETRDRVIPNPAECFSKGPLTPALSREGRGSPGAPVAAGRYPLPLRERVAAMRPGEGFGMRGQLKPGKQIQFHAKGMELTMTRGPRRVA